MKERSTETSGKRIRWVSLGATLLLFVAVAICLSVVLNSLSAGYVMIGGKSVFRVVTGSMEPEIPVGALLLAEREDITNIRKGDVVCFRSQQPGMLGMIITHRVVEVYQAPDGSPLLQTKGDANLSVDADYVTEANLIGRVAWHTGDGSKMAAIVTFLTGDIGFLACIVLPVLLIAVWIFRDAIKSLKKEIRAAEQAMKEQATDSSVPVLTEEEYAALYKQVADEVRKELKQDAASVADGGERRDSGTVESIEEQSSASTDSSMETVPESDSGC